MSNELVGVQVQESGDMGSLPNAIIEWRKIQDRMSTLKAEVRECTRRSKAYEEYIMKIMKKNSIGALDLKQSNARLLYKKKKRSAGLGPKTLEKLLGAHLGDSEKAKEAVKYVLENRESSTKESLAYERLELDI
jgi:hypothetical protein